MSKAEAALSQKISELPPGTLRHSIVLAARRFKASWVELGKLLVQVRDQNSHEEWGYPTFDAYCLKELHIRRSTADKLVRSFSFLDRHEPKAVASEDFVQKAPAFEVIEVLADAEERGQLSPSEYRSVRDSIWSEDRSDAEVKKELTERFPRPLGDAPAEGVQLRKLASAVRRLATELSASRTIPKAVAERAVALAEEVEELTAGSAEA